jgi:hypothetical protein
LPNQSNKLRYLARGLILSVMFAVVVATASTAFAHGTPIQVGVSGTALTVGVGLSDPAGFASTIFVEDDEDGDPFGSVTLPGFGPATIWQIPGFEITGMDEHCGLFLDVLIRPFAHRLPTDQQSLWYWNPATEKVEIPQPTASGAVQFQIRKSSTVAVTIEANKINPPPMQIAEPVAADMGFHNHLVAYALGESSGPPVGAYGFFARLTSNQYTASDPFLIVINYGVDYAQMTTAALAINAAAFLPGDYNRDERVDAADYVLWRKTLNSMTLLEADGSYNDLVDAPDYDMWRRAHGTFVAGSGLSTASVPEAHGFAILLSCLACILLQRRSGYGRVLARSR